MSRGAHRIVAVNPGTTSTKYGVFAVDEALVTGTLRHPDADLAPFAGRPILDQLDTRHAALRGALADAVQGRVDAVVGRGGLLAPVPGGTYAVDDDVLADLAAARRGEHASNLGPFLAHRLAAEFACPAFLVDPVSVDEWADAARFSGLAGVERESLSHALNSKAVARRHARERGARYEELRLVVVHLGSGITVSAHADGRMVDACNSMEEGPFAMDRAGAVPALKLLALATSGTTSPADLRRRLFGDGGVYSYLGTRDLQEVLRRIEQGDERAARVIDAMLYQVTKEAGAMAAVLAGRVHAVLLTGGMAHAERVVDALTRSLSWIAPVHPYPGEDELQALAQGALRVLRGEQPALRYAQHRLRPG
jgi:butyrate kinase